jgi:hypothetical protein
VADKFVSYSRYDNANEQALETTILYCHKFPPDGWFLGLLKR